MNKSVLNTIFLIGLLSSGVTLQGCGDTIKAAIGDAAQSAWDKAVAAACGTLVQNTISFLYNEAVAKITDACATLAGVANTECLATGAKDLEVAKTTEGTTKEAECVAYVKNITASLTDFAAMKAAVTNYDGSNGEEIKAEAKAWFDKILNNIGVAANTTAARLYDLDEQDVHFPGSQAAQSNYNMPLMVLAGVLGASALLGFAVFVRRSRASSEEVDEELLEDDALE